MSLLHEASDTFQCFGSRCGVFVIGDSRAGSAEQAVGQVRRSLLSWHERFSRFEPHSELTRLNRDPRPEVPVSDLMARLAAAATRAASVTGGLVDATLLEEIERAGYRSHHETSVPLDIALALAPPRQPAGPALDERWRSIEVDLAARTIGRPPGVQLDSGGIAKGLFADILGEQLAGHESYAIDCGGDLRLGGIGRHPRTVRVASPFGDEVVHELEVADGGIATSGIGKRSWIDADGVSAHHVLDPATGRPAFTGIVQVTALAPTGLEAEIAAKAALLSGPEEAGTWLPDGGVIVFDDTSHEVVAPRWARAPAAVAR
ncbi:MAG: FAD:protein transferase [Solirubrobacteraceae bacterium]|jgi:thiamine biosynthesis lipoprotein|nr:FAD:protein transferase [Solirubrobacteraceae bacterium]